MASIDETTIYVNDVFKSNNSNNDKVHARMKADKEKAEAAAKGEAPAADTKDKKSAKAPSFPG